MSLSYLLLFKIKDRISLELKVSTMSEVQEKIDKHKRNHDEVKVFRQEQFVILKRRFK